MQIWLNRKCNANRSISHLHANPLICFATLHNAISKSCWLSCALVGDYRTWIIMTWRFQPNLINVPLITALFNRRCVIVLSRPGGVDACCFFIYLVHRHAAIYRRRRMQTLLHERTERSRIYNFLSVLLTGNNMFCWEFSWRKKLLAKGSTLSQRSQNNAGYTIYDP